VSAVAEISVVVPTRDRVARLEALVEALRRQTLGGDRFEVIVVDDASSDASPAYLERIAGEQPFARFEVVRREASAGPGAARNSGWPRARAPLVAFTDDDCEPEAGWLEELLRVAKDHPGAVVQGRTVPNPREVGELSLFARTLDVRGGPWYPTCNIAYPRELLERLGGFDATSYPWAAEDADLAWRALEGGAVIVFAENARVAHAVNVLGPLGSLRQALRWSDGVLVLARHPGLRRQMLFERFWKPSHAKLLLALAGVMLTRRTRLGLLLTLPYLREARGRCRAHGQSEALIPYVLLHDAVETFAVVRGAVRHRVAVL
jgi:glycosyltransferase involved in cell wall biosynthesis